MRIILVASILFLTSCGTYKPNDFVYNSPSFRGKSNCNIDSDKDGINDCLDRCPKTPKGVSVDTHACPKDTDGDGVADYKDEELITLSSCQPSDSNGVGDCNRK